MCAQAAAQPVVVADMTQHVQAYDPASEQLVRLQAEDLAIEDALYYLERYLGLIDYTRYIPR